MSNFVHKSLRVFVGNLPWTVGQKDLQQYFSRFGYVSDSVVIYNKQQGLSKGYGFVTFNTRDAYNSARNQRIHFLDGRVLSVTDVKS